MSGAPALDARGLPPGYPFKPDLEVTPRDVKAALTDQAIYLVDCRNPSEWAAAKIPHAILIPMQTVESKVDDIVEAAAGRPVVVHCHMGGRSMKVALFLRSRGIEARSMAGGIDAWSLGVDPTVPRY